MDVVFREVGPIVGAIIGGIVGAVAWAIVAVTSGYEIGFLAWGVGCLVGAGSNILGGEGIGQGLLCGALALVSIFCGKMLVAHYVIGDEMNKVQNLAFSEAQYNEIAEDAKHFNAEGSLQEFREFMVERNYIDVASPDDVSTDDVKMFMANHMDTLVSMQGNTMTYEQWRAEQEAWSDEALGEMSLVDITFNSLDAMDIIFAVFGIASAVQIGALGGDE